MKIVLKIRVFGFGFFFKTVVGVIIRFLVWGKKISIIKEKLLNIYW